MESNQNASKKAGDTQSNKSKSTATTNAKGAEGSSPQPQEPKPRDRFKFEVGCDHTPEFKTAYELIYKSNILYQDANGYGHSYTSEITGGAAGDGHNNVVTTSAEQTQFAMSLANNMQ